MSLLYFNKAGYCGKLQQNKFSNAELVHCNYFYKYQIIMCLGLASTYRSLIFLCTARNIRLCEPATILPVHLTDPATAGKEHLISGKSMSNNDKNQPSVAAAAPQPTPAPAVKDKTLSESPQIKEPNAPDQDKVGNMRPKQATASRQ